MKKKVLLIDDQKEFSMLLKIFLSKKYTVETSENGLRALARLQNGYFPDVIVTDLMMPEVDGKTFIMQIKNSGAFNHIPIIVLSSIDKSSEKVDLLKSGASDYIIKPFNPDELDIRIDKVLKTA